MATRMTKLSSVDWLKQPDGNAGLLFDTVRTFAASGAGSTTTIVSTGLAGSGNSDDDFVGWIVECVDSDNTQNQGLRRRIIAADDSESTYTIDALPAATASGDQFVLYKPPHAIAVAAAGSSTTTNYVTTRDRNETNGRYSGTAAEGGPYLVVVNAGAASMTNHPLVSTNLASNTKISLATSLTGAVALGDYFELWKHPEIINDGLFECTQELIERNAMTGTYGRPASRAGNRSASATLELAFRGPGAGRAGSHAEAHEMLSCTMAFSNGTNSTVDAASSTTSVTYSSGNHAVGQLAYTADGYACMVTADSGSAYTVSPALGVAPAATSTLYGVTTYKPTTSVQGAIAVRQWRGDDILEYIWGAVPAISFSATKGDFLRISGAFQGADWLRVGASGTALTRAYLPKRSTVDQLKCGIGRGIIDGSAFAIRSLNFDAGMDLQQRVNVNAPNDTDGFALVGDNPTGTIEVYNGATERKALDDFLAGKEITMLAQFGAAPGFPGVFIFYAYKIRYTGAAIGDDAGQVTLSLPFQVIEDPTAAAGIPRYAIGIL